MALRMLHDLASNPGVWFHHTAWCSSANAMHQAKRRGIAAIATASPDLAKVFDGYLQIKRDEIQFEVDRFVPQLLLESVTALGFEKLGDNVRSNY